MGIIRMFSGELPLSPSEKRVRKERTGYGSDLDKLFKQTWRKASKKRVFNPKGKTRFASIKNSLKRGDVVINTHSFDTEADYTKYKVFVISSDGTSSGENAEVGMLRRINAKAKRVTLALPLTKEHDYSERIGFYPFEDPLLI